MQYGSSINTTKYNRIQYLQQRKIDVGRNIAKAKYKNNNKLLNAYKREITVICDRKLKCKI